jgi:hypothetical protein
MHCAIISIEKKRKARNSACKTESQVEAENACLYIFLKWPCQVTNLKSIQIISKVSLIANNTFLIVQIRRAQSPRHVKKLITNYAFCIVQRGTAQSKTRIIRGHGVAEGPPVFNDSHRSELSY